jgi:hypothetical protein
VEQDQAAADGPEQLVDHYAPFFLKLCELVRLVARYGRMKDSWSSELLEATSATISEFAFLHLRHKVEAGLPTSKTLLVAMATFCDLCHPSFGARDHFLAASRAVHDCGRLRQLIGEGLVQAVSPSHQVALYLCWHPLQRLPRWIRESPAVSEPCRTFREWSSLPWSPRRTLLGQVCCAVSLLRARWRRVAAD